MDIRAQNGQLLRMFCTLDMGTSLFSGDAQVARTTYSNFGTLRHRFGAIQIRSWRKPSRVRSDDDSIQISLIRFFTQRPCLDLRCQALTYLRSGLAWTSAARPLLCDARQSLTAVDFPICFFVSVVQIRTGLGLFFG
jgi:hypothetical protein